MNQLYQTTGTRKWPTWWQWLVIVWLIVLNASPYLFAYLSTSNLGTLDVFIWSMLTGPFAQTGMLSFFLVAGALPIFIRRLTFVAGLLVVVGIVMIALDLQSLGTIVWFLLEAAALVGLALTSAWLFNMPVRPKKWSPQFSLAEILALSGLLGIFLFMARLAEATTLSYWRQAQETVFIAFAISCGIYLFPACLATISQGRKRLIGMIVFCVLLWTVFALFVLGALIVLDENRPLNDRQFLILLYPTFAFQLMLIWGTFFPIRAWLPGVLKLAPATAAQCKSDTLADAPENCRQSEHTDVPD
ncbi:hypothetical protein [Bremerella sp. P1]|uniref:hypothetical protein n=1 Tax=Bremerella sp. P1 TaxID=3026424 RepID=UPI002368A659|nr:hypothetical protein [Bremerella sp. P1]WDI44387.1 hypothetical protein PSR63_10630 [Bremerella sp. P1]